MSHELHDIDVAAYAMNRLDGAELAQAEAHLDACVDCRADVATLVPVVRLAELARGLGAPPSPPVGLGARTLLAVQAAAAATASAASTAPAEATAPASARRRSVPARQPWWRALGPRPIAIGLATVIAVGVATTSLLEEENGPGSAGLEVVATLRSAAGANAAVEVTKTGIGRVVRFDTTDLPILPKGEYYELWWVGPGDRRGRPNRISAGTFHPDEQGRSRVTFAAAVDPAVYPRLAVRAEPGDGNPSPHGADVLRGAVRAPA